MFSRLESITECHRVSQRVTECHRVSRKTPIYFIFTSKTQNLFAHPPEVVTMAKKFVTTLKGCNNGKIKLLQRLQVVTMAN